MAGAGTGDVDWFIIDHSSETKGKEGILEQGEVRCGDATAGRRGRGSPSNCSPRLAYPVSALTLPYQMMAKKRVMKEVSAMIT